MPKGEYLLHYYLTGETDYKNLPAEKRCRFQLPDPGYPYQSSDYAFRVQGGGTSMGAISSAVTCSVFYKYLRWLDPVDAHNMAAVLYAGLSIFVLYWFSLEAFGRRTAVLASLFLAFFPALVGYSHVLIKDLPVFCFVSLTIWSFWKGVTRNRYKWIWLSMIFLGMGLVAKMNAAYAVIILACWLPIPLRQRAGIFARVTGKFWRTLFFYPVTVILTFMFFSPRIWYEHPYNLVNNIGRTITVMTGIYTYVANKNQKISPYEQKRIKSAGKLKKKKFNMGQFLRKIFYAPLYALISIPLTVLLLAFCGLWFLITGKGAHAAGDGWLVVCWAFVPLVFCMLPFIFIHSGIREFFPFIQGVCLLAGLGGDYLYRLIKEKYEITPEKGLAVYLGVLALSVGPEIISVMQYHPYESAFVNSLVGGLKGAQTLRLPFSGRVGIPQVGDSRGGSFRNSLKWLDKHGKAPSIVIIWATSSKFIAMTRDIKIILDDWDNSYKEKRKLRKIDFDTVYIVFNHYYWNLVHPLYGYCYKNLTPIYTASANGAPVNYVYRMSRKDFFKLILPRDA
ncbi:MAG: ArnT family glycosyltransferase [bacterium]